MHQISQDRQPPEVPPMSFIEQDRLMKERRRVKQLSNRQALEKQMEEKKLLNDFDHDFSIKKKEKQFATSLKMIKNEMPIQVKSISHEIHEKEQRLL
jgi:hypothetical protein